jgi:[protein-PII] uridylyltransferase
VDEAVRALCAGTEGLSDRVAVVALGGYGRESLCPGSDVDLMVLHGERRPGRTHRAAEALFYPFWDAGIALGHSVRTVDESVRLALERLDVACSLLDARTVWGDERLVEGLMARLGRALGREPGRFLTRIEEDAVARRERFGSCSADLEPDLKEGTGGLRDMLAARWIGRALFSAPSTRRLVEGGLLRAREATALEETEEFLTRVRSALHLENGRRTDRLVQDLQPTLAASFGYEATAGLDAADALMRALFEHARQVEQTKGAFLARAAARLGVTPGEQLDPAPPRTPDDLVEAFADAARADRTFTAEGLDRLESAELGPAPYAWTSRTRRAFVEILGAGEPGARALEAMDRADLLAPFLPEWEAVRCRPQRDPYHRHSVDVHLLETAATAAAILEGRPGDDPILRQAAGSIGDREGMFLGSLLHDIGKRGEGRHVEVGIRVADGAVDRMGVGGRTRDRVAFLVREHLLLADTAARRDLSDENLVVDVAARIGDPERLAMLYVLTVADAEATGPHASTPWRMALVRELVGKAQRVLERGDLVADASATLEAHRAEIKGLLDQEDRVAVAGYLDRMPRAYLASVSPEVAARHFPLVTPPLGSAEVRTDVAPGARPGTHEVTVVAADRPGLLARIAGALTLSGLTILSAEAFTTEDGAAVDLFAVEPAFAGEVDAERWRAVRRDLRRALEGRISLEHRVREKRRHYPASASAVPLEVTSRNDVSDFSTVVEVSAADRIGLLYDLARAFEELALDVHLAKVATYGPRVVDAFYVRDLEGRKVEDPEMLAELERAIRARVGSG